MGLEAASFISQLVSTNPTLSDAINQGDDHLRLIKAVLKAQFPNLGAAAMTANASALNALGSAGYAAATAVATLTGCTTAPTVTVSFERIGGIVVCKIPAILATSNSNSATLTLSPPGGFWPSTFGTQAARTQDNGVAGIGSIGLGSSNLFALYAPGAAGTAAFTSSGAKGIPDNIFLHWLADV